MCLVAYEAVCFLFPVSPFPVFILPQSLCSLRSSSVTASRKYCRFICRFSAKLFVQPSQCSFLTLVCPAPFPFPVHLLAFLFAQRPSTSVQGPFCFWRLRIYSNLCLGTYLPHSFKCSRFLLVLPGPSMKVTGKPVKLWSCNCRESFEQYMY